MPFNINFDLYQKEVVEVPILVTNSKNQMIEPTGEWSVNEVPIIAVHNPSGIESYMIHLSGGLDFSKN